MEELAGPPSFAGRVKAFRARHAQKESVLFFLSGFLFDAVMLKRIDEPLMLAQQGAYLLLAGALLAVTQRYHHLKLAPPAFLQRHPKLLEHLIHFMMGTLLNAYSIFYFQSASGLTAITFVAVIAFLLAVNEMPRFHRFGPLVLYALYSICLTSYFAYLLPVLCGNIRPWMFYAAVLTALVPIALHVYGMLRWTKDVKTVAREVVIPAVGVQLVFVLLYALHLAPPVPLAVKEMGIYHRVEHTPGEWRLLRQSHGWKFWRKGDQDFQERPGDRVFCFARIFAPKGFHDDRGLRAVWFLKDARHGWRVAHRMTLGISASAERGFATDAYLTEPAAGDWRVEIQSADGRTMGQLHFTVSLDASTEPRAFIEEVSSTAAPEKTRG